MKKIFLRKNLKEGINWLLKWNIRLKKYKKIIPQRGFNQKFVIRILFVYYLIKLNIRKFKVLKCSVVRHRLEVNRL